MSDFKEHSVNGNTTGKVKWKDNAEYLLTTTDSQKGDWVTRRN